MNPVVDASRFRIGAKPPKIYGDAERAGMPNDRRRPVTIDQPPVNKITVFALACATAFVALLFASKIDAALFQGALLAFAVATGVYAYRAIQVTAEADADGITVTNLRRSSRHRWSEVDGLSVAPVPRGPGNGLQVDLVDGTSVPIEASWGAWYEGKQQAAGNTLRCEQIIARIDAMRSGVAVEEQVETEEFVDPVAIRPMTTDDVETAAAVLSTAWNETYGDILTHHALYSRDREDDIRILAQFAAGDIPHGGALVATRHGEIVGLSVFGPPDQQRSDLGRSVEIYLLYVLADHQRDRIGARLTIRTMYAARARGATSVVGHVHVGYRRFRRSIEARSVEPAGEPVEHNWYGLPVNVVPYEKAFGPTLASNPPLRR